MTGYPKPRSATLDTAPSPELYDALIAPYLDEYTSGAFEEMAREYVRRYGREILPSAAREVGKLLAPDFHVDVAGLLLDGSAVFGDEMVRETHGAESDQRATKPGRPARLR